VQALQPHETDKPAYDYRTPLWLTDLNGSPRQLTRGKESVSRTVWVSDKALLFTHTVKGGGAGGGWSTSSDLATFAEAYMAGKLFSKATLASMTKAHATLPPPPGRRRGGSASCG